jgi:hypothetical protein
MDLKRNGVILNKTSTFTPPLLVRFIIFAKFYCAHILLYYSSGIRNNYVSRPTL